MAAGHLAPDSSGDPRPPSATPQQQVDLCTDLLLIPLRQRGCPPGRDPLAHLTPAAPRADVPVLLRQARCDGHARGEIKKPYDFLVWVGPADGEQPAVNPAIADRDAAAFEAVCHLGWHA